MSKYIEVELRDGIYKFSPLTLEELEQHEAAILRCTEEPGVKGFSAAVGPLVASLRHQHPDMTEDRVKKIVDIANARAAIEAMFGVSGLKKAEPGEAAPQPGS